MSAIEKHERLHNVEGEGGGGYADSLDHYMDRKQAGAYVGLSDHWLARNVSEPGAPPFVRVGRRTWYRREDLDAFMQRRAAAAQAAKEAAKVPSAADMAKVARAFGEPGKVAEPSLTRDVDALHHLGDRCNPIQRDSLTGFDSWPDGIYRVDASLIIKKTTWP